MKNRKENKIKNTYTNLKRFIASLIFLAITTSAQAGSLYAKTHVENSGNSHSVEQRRKFILSTSVLGLLVLAYPDENTFYFQLDFGRTLKNHDNVMLGFMMYQYRRPHSTPFNDVSTYNGYVLSYGPVFAYQHFFWKGFFAMPMINPLLMDYRQDNKEKINRGFMLLCAARVGYSFDFRIGNIPFFIEPSVEINFWPVNVNVPADFKTLESKYKDYVFAPGLNFGLRF